MFAPHTHRTIFFTCVQSRINARCTRRLVESLRRFAGSFSQNEFWLFSPDPHLFSLLECETLGIKTFQISVPESVRHYLFAEKVWTCAQAEVLAGQQVDALVWLNPEVLVLRPPADLELWQEFDAAVRPVHIQNVGLRVDSPVNNYWHQIYNLVGVQDVQVAVESFVDAQPLRAYYNSGVFSLRPSLCLAQRWFDIFERLVLDLAFQEQACQDEWHQIFLHQAVWSSLLAVMLAPERVRSLPPEYGYPIHLNDSLPSNRRARTLDELVCPIYEDLEIAQGELNGLAISPELQAWLAEIG
jgi:hypothetical protein